MFYPTFFCLFIAYLSFCTYGYLEPAELLKSTSGQNQLDERQRVKKCEIGIG